MERGKGHPKRARYHHVGGRTREKPAHQQAKEGLIVGKTGGRERPSREDCTHTTCLVSRAPGGGMFFGRCLVCGKTGPGRATSEAAREALAVDDGRTPDDGRST